MCRQQQHSDARDETDASAHTHDDQDAVPVGRHDTELEDNLRCLTRRFHRERMERGPHLADEAWVDKPFDNWLDGLSGNAPRLKDSNLVALAVAMAEALAVRDALIVSLVIGGEHAPKPALIGFAARPHEPSNVRLMCRLLSGAFEDGGAAPDRERCRRGIAMLEAMARSMPGRFRVQPLAIVAYTLWWMADGRCEGVAARALALDQECTLAAIVLSALQHGIRPAWCRNRERPKHE